MNEALMFFNGLTWWGWFMMMSFFCGIAICVPHTNYTWKGGQNPIKPPK